MSGVNKVIVVGRLGTDPEVKTVGNGGTVTRLSVATSESWTDKEGAKQERTEWHKITVWGRLAEICGKHLAKGRQVYVEGRLQTRQWEDQQGQKRYSTEIVANTVQFLGGQSERSGDSGSYDRGNSGGGPSSRVASGGGGGQGGGRGGDDYGAQDFGPEPSFDSSEEIPF